MGLLNRVGPFHFHRASRSSRPVHRDSPNRVGPFAETARPRQLVSVGSLVEQLDRSFLLSSLLQDSPSWGLLRHVVCDIASSLQPMLCHHSIGGSIQIVEEYIVRLYDVFVDCIHLTSKMRCSMSSRAALFLLQTKSRIHQAHHPTVSAVTRLLPDVDTQPMIQEDEAETSRPLHRLLRRIGPRMDAAADACPNLNDR